LIVVATVVKVFGSRMGEQGQETERKSDHNADELTSAAIGVPHRADDAATENERYAREAGQNFG
jgi:hypothetical protein